MRQDMRKVLCERPRAHSSCCYHDVRAAENRGDLEDLPHHQGMRRPFGRHDYQKEFSDHISPLMRFLWGCIGRPWNDVWSEICAAVPSNNTVDQHLKGHVTDFIDIHTYMNGDEVWVKNQRYRAGLYVDPRDGIVCATKDYPSYHYGDNTVMHRGLSYVKDENGILHPAPRYRGRWKGGSFVTKRLNSDEDAIQIQGIWYKVRYAIVPPARIQVFIEDGETMRKIVPETRIDAVFGTTVYSNGSYHAAKKQMSSSELRKHALMNESSS